MAQTPSDITLPAEILDTVIDELGCSQDSDPESLNALLYCALVCRSFHHRAAGHLFANVVVTNRRKDYYEYNRIAVERLEDLSQILQKNDSIGPRILSFSLDTSLSSPHPGDLQTNPSNIIRYGKTLPNVLRLLCSIRRFSWRNHRSHVFCKDLGSDLADAITSLGERASLKSVSIQCIELDVFPLPVLFKLDHLSFTHALLPQEWDSSTPSIRQNDYPTRLRELVLYGCPELTPWISQTPALFSQLTRFNVWMRSDDEVLVAWLVMQAASQTLEVLKVSDISHFRCPCSIIRMFQKTLLTPPFTDPNLIPGPIDLGILQSLHTIALSFTIASFDNVVFPMCICGLLKPPTSPTQLKNIEIQLNWIDCVQGSEEARLVEEPGWRVLDDILSQESLHPQLSNVFFKLKLGYGWRQHPFSNRPPAEIVIIRDTVASLASKLFQRTVAARSWRPNIDIEIYKSTVISH